MPEKQRCRWAGLAKDFYLRYHDKEWGVPVHDDRLMFEFLTLEAFQAGLSWEIILRKRENFRRAFRNFDPQIVAGFGETEIAALLQDAGIIRNRLKIRATIRNAGKFLEIAAQSGSFCAWFWDYVDGRPIVNHWHQLSEMPANTELSDRIARDLKQRGFKFLGSTVMYAHMQAVGMVNDHEVRCFRHEEVQKL